MNIIEVIIIFIRKMNELNEIKNIIKSNQDYLIIIENLKLFLSCLEN